MLKEIRVRGTKKKWEFDREMWEIEKKRRCGKESESEGLGLNEKCDD